jgi:endonuclease YncB( thermonuclease family)
MCCFNKIIKLTSVNFKDKNVNDIVDPISYKDTIQFVPPIKKGVVIKVYDGDTITIASKLPYKESPIYRFSVRLSGIDCPEIKGKDEKERKIAELAKKELSNLIMNKVVILENVKTEKYGRVLADVYIDNINLSNYMIEKGLAVPYDGTAKESPKDWVYYYNNWLNHFNEENKYHS